MSNAGLLHGAHDFILNNPHLNDNSTNVNIHNTIVEHKHSGLKMLLEASMPDAFHDSSARDPPPSCHPGTRHDFVDTITSWGLGASQHTVPMLWIEMIHIATKSKPFGDILDERIKDDPMLVTKSMREQFQELLVKPLSRLGPGAAGVLVGSVVIIDGLDECGNGPGMHCDIIEIVATSVRNRTAPFRW
ncbi:hypothetical protein P691DRAFT_767580 [Macrolepiota fuliginosa MF-IS2]|uniref:Uncharacterized protein n=1 Tax=Macrolepiota fuliginosa MF-IS2 TaxID=1400762 RepID=A0A9P5WZG2_9AGAR|nr:hypothetical protein P691DRAFT_767580 [Macrolepiota fuliginosa MF-IS2]